VSRRLKPVRFCTPLTCNLLASKDGNFKALEVGKGEDANELILHFISPP
jgi:hypothetical protein